MERLVHFTLFGQEFSFYTDAPDEEVDEIVTMVQEEFGAVDQVGRSTVPASKLLVLGCLRLAAKNISLGKDFENFRAQHEASIDKLIAKVASGID